MIVTGSPGQSLHRDLITTLAARHRLPAIYPANLFAAAGEPVTWIASKGAKSPQIFWCKHQQSTNW